ncbi:hypothetical protein N9C35_04860, partial [Flavobacteriaceae bacterium]|nr:hypothetical protein [Flavobacteriaceae bacterium]
IQRLKSKIAWNFDLDEAKIKLEILVLKYHLQKAEDQDILLNISDGNKINEKQNSFFDYKTIISKQILALESE